MRASSVWASTTFLCPQWVSGVGPTWVHSQPRNATVSGFVGSPATALHWRIASAVSRQARGEMNSAWSLIDQKSSAEQ
jgi:hypothetical protein